MQTIFQTLTHLALRGMAALALCLVIASAAQAQEAAPQAAADPRAALIEILRDPETREALIAELEQSAETEVAAEVADEAPVSLARRLATTTQDAAQAVVTRSAAAWAALRNASAALDGVGSAEIGILIDAVRDLFLVIVSTIAAYLGLRAVARALFRRMDVRAENSSLAGKTFLFVVSAVVDVGVVVLAWAIGYALAATVIGQYGEIAIRQSLYLNAFFAVEMLKVVLRLGISPTSHELRLLPLSDRGARRLYRTLTVGVSIVGYGLLLIVPIVNANASMAAGNSVATLVILIAVLYLGTAVLRRRQAVADWLLAQGRSPVPAPEEGMPEGGEVVVEHVDGEPQVRQEPRRTGFYATFARRWHVAALLWLGLVLVTSVTQPVSGVFTVLRVSALVGIAILAAVGLSGVLSRAIGAGVRLPPKWTETLPRLEGRLNGFVPQILTGLRWVLFLALALFILEVTSLVAVREWLAGPAGLAFVGTVVSVLAIVAVSFAIWLALTSWVEFRLNPDVGSAPTAREQTLLTLLRNALTIVLLIITLMFALSEIGLDIGPLLASAGVLGLAIGFGAQKLVQDVITGVFIQFENAMNVGDVVTAGPVTGVVEKLTIRSVSLRDLHGVYHLIPFSSVDAVSNYMRDFSFYVVDMGVAYREDIEEVRQAMFDAYEELRADAEQGQFLMGDLEWFGLNQFGDSAIVLRARIKTIPGKQWGVGRAYNGIVKRIFDERGIEIPFPHTTLFFGEDKKGRTQALKVDPTPLPEG